jgi:hypothetical protein
MDTVLPVADGVVADPVRAGDLDLGGMVLCRCRACMKRWAQASHAAARSDRIADA